MDGQYQFNHPVVQSREAVAAGSSADTLKFDVVRAGRVHVIENVAVLDVNNAPTSVEIYLEGGGSSHYLDGASAPTAAIVKAFKGPFIVPENHRLVVYFNTATANDAISAHVNGRELIRED